MYECFMIQRFDLCARQDKLPYYYDYHENIRLKLRGKLRRRKRNKTCANTRID